jgi:hypothetical protein
VSWNPEEMRALALVGCRQCWGAGVKWRPGLTGRPYPCECALRTIFRACLARYRYCQAQIGKPASVRLTMLALGPRRFLFWGLPDQEYCADFCLLGRRVLSGLDYEIFRLHFLLGGDWIFCCRKLGMERGKFFRQAYLVEQRLGYALRTVKPYALHPVGEYFLGTARPKGCAAGGMS